MANRPPRDDDRPWPSYQPGGEYQPWDQDSGSSRLSGDGDSHDAAFTDSGSSRSKKGSADSDSQPSSSLSSPIDALRRSETNAAKSTMGSEPSYYRGNGGKNGPGAGKGNVKAKGIKGKIAVIGFIASFIIGGGAFISSSNSLLAGALEALFTSATDTQYTSYSLRVPQIMKHMIQGGSQTTVTWYGVKKYTFMSPSFQNRLSKFGIEVEGSGTSRILKWNNETITADQFINKYHSDIEFRDAYSSAKRGRVATFFDNIADKIYQKLGLSRNLFSKYRQTGDSDADAASFRDTMTPEFEGNTTNLSTGSKQEETYTVEGENGEDIEVTREYNDYNSGSSENKSTSTASAESQASSFVSGLASKAAAVTGVLDQVCAVLKVGNLISMAVAANEIYSSINYFMGLIENISKMKSGEGDASAINELLNFLSVRQTTQIPNLGIFDRQEKEEVTGSMLEANGMQMVLAGAPALSSTTKNYSLDRTTSALTRALGFNTFTATGCALTQIAESALSMAVTIGSGGLAKIVGSFFVTTVVNFAISQAVSAALGFLIPTIAQALFTNVFESVVGKPAGELWTRGASAANTRVGRSGSAQSLSSASVANAYNHATNTVLAMDAEIDRKNLSPFDITNRNTFFGSIAYSLLPTITSTNITSVTSLARSVSTSLASLMGRVSAEGEGSSYMTTFGNCPSLEEIGAVGDIYCNPVTTTDLTTVNMSPDNAKYQQVLTSSGEGNTVVNMTCDTDGNCTINDDSNLARYISYCDGRDSPFGILDSGILSNFEASNSLGAFGSLLNSIPFVGDVVSVIDAIGSLDPLNQKWATGANCVNSSENPLWDSEMKYYQRYVEDQRILEQMGVYEGSQNPVLAYEEKYASEHPIDMSEAGILAHYSGMSKEDAELTIAVLDIYHFIDEYDATPRIALQQDTLKQTDSTDLIAKWEQGRYHEAQPEVVSDPLETKSIARQQVVYFDVRNRSYAA